VSIQTCSALYLSEYKVECRDGKYHGKHGPLIQALNEHFTHLDIFVPRLEGAQRYLQGLRTFDPKLTRWKTRFAVSIHSFRAESQIIEKYLQKQTRPYDLIIQEFSLFMPGTHLEDRTYVVVADNTAALSLKYWPEWAPFRSGRERDVWLSAERALYQNATCLFPASELVASSLQHDYGCSPERIASPIGFGSNLIAKSIDGKDYEPQITLFVGYEARRKGLWNLLNVWPTIREEHPAAELWVVGTEPVSGYRDVAGVKWLGLVKDRSQMQDIYARATLYAMPSFYEPFALSFLEAMGHGIACIGPDGFGGANEVIKDDETGYCVPPGDEQQLAHSLKKLLESEPLRRQLGHNAYQAILRDYTWEAVVSRMLPHLEKALNLPCQNLAANEVDDRRCNGVEYSPPVE
jgi:glycosyltransferase involved in cell wall biosynthesis